MVENGYKRKFVNKVIRRQIRRSERSRTTSDENRGKTSVQLPFIDGLSQEVRRIVREANIRCTFTAPNTLQKLHNVKDSLPLCSATHAIYSIKCKTQCARHHSLQTESSSRRAGFEAVCCFLEAANVAADDDRDGLTLQRRTLFVPAPSFVERSPTPGERLQGWKFPLSAWLQLLAKMALTAVSAFAVEDGEPD